MAMLRSSSEMKDSGIEWVGQMPQTWQIAKLKYLGTYVNGFAFKPSDWGIKGKPIIRIQDLTGSNAGEPNYFDGELDAKYLVHSGDILVSWAATLDAFIWDKDEGWLNQHIFKAIPVDTIDKHYFLWLLKITMANMNNDNKHGIVMQHVTTGVFNNYQIPLAPFTEQQAIADYLDDRCSKIDEITAEATESIEEYKQLKQAVIFEVVTKGLDKNVPMKDSGVEWIGMIPQGWNIKKFKYVATVSANLVAPDDYMDLQQIAPDCIEKDSGRLIKERTVAEAGVESWNQLFHKGQLIYSKIRPILNKVVIAPYDGLCSADMYPLDVKENINFVQKAMLSRYFVEQVGLITQDRVKMPKINKEELADILMAVPPMKEQIDIVEYLDTRMTDIDKVIDEKQALIEDLQAYKKSLIYEVVTGKRKVV